jgi:hypothetical protein
MYWRYELDGTFEGFPCFVIIDDKNYCVAEEIRDEDHARLIATAPELLEALELMLAFDIDPDAPNNEPSFYVRLAKAKEAIKKARGT